MKLNKYILNEFQKYFFNWIKNSFEGLLLSKIEMPEIFIQKSSNSKNDLGFFNKKGDIILLDKNIDKFCKTNDYHQTCCKTLAVKYLYVKRLLKYYSKKYNKEFSDDDIKLLTLLFIKDLTTPEESARDYSYIFKSFYENYFGEKIIEKFKKKRNLDYLKLYRLLLKK